MTNLRLHANWQGFAPGARPYPNYREIKRSYKANSILGRDLQIFQITLEYSDLFAF